MRLDKKRNTEQGRSPNLFGAHRYTICDGMCALRGVLRTVKAFIPRNRPQTVRYLEIKAFLLPCVFAIESEVKAYGS